MRVITQEPKQLSLTRISLTSAPQEEGGFMKNLCCFKEPQLFPDVSEILRKQVRHATCYDNRTNTSFITLGRKNQSVFLPEGNQRFSEPEGDYKPFGDQSITPTNDITQNSSAKRQSLSRNCIFRSTVYRVSPHRSYPDPSARTPIASLTMTLANSPVPSAQQFIGLGQRRAREQALSRKAKIEDYAATIESNADESSDKQSFAVLVEEDVFECLTSLQRKMTHQSYPSVAQQGNHKLTTLE